jgi:endonuclease G
MKSPIKIICFALSAGVLVAAGGGAWVYLRRHAAPDNNLSTNNENMDTTEIRISKSGFCLIECPEGAPQNDEPIARHVLQLENDPRTKFADWVAYKIMPEYLDAHGCSRKWKQDPDLPDADTLAPRDYKGVKEALQSDRGHQAPLSSLCGSPYNFEANYLSNITPQKSALNEGPWENLERGERKITPHHGAIYSITGPLYERPMPNLPETSRQETTPSGYWKLVSYTDGRSVYAAAFIMDQNMDRNADFCATAVSMTELKKRTKLTFFSGYRPSGTAADPYHTEIVLQELHCS